MEQILELLGYMKPEGVTLALFAAQFVFAAIGATVRLAYDAAKRNPDSTRTPHDFSLSFFAKDNAFRVLVGAPSMYLMLYFLDYFISAETPRLLLGFSAVVGIYSDMIVRTLDKGLRSKIKTISERLFPTNQRP